MNSLKAGTQLQNGKYKIEEVLGQGGFGITYLASQELLDRKVCIKEFFFKDYCNRDGETSQVTIGTQSNHDIVERFMNKFLKEARTISQLDHRNIVKIHDIFKENNTAYYVMDYIEGESLNDMVNRRGALPSNEAVAYISRVADALKYLHERNINHLDIKPANIMIRNGDLRVFVIDFGVSKQYDEQGGQTSTTPVGISHGYAPMEQYKQGGVSTFSPQTDIYALGATLYKLVTGKTPPQAMDVLDDGLPPLPSSVTPALANAIKKAMQPLKKDRPQSVKEFASLVQTSRNKTENNIRKTTDFVEEKYIERARRIAECVSIMDCVIYMLIIILCIIGPIVFFVFIFYLAVEYDYVDNEGIAFLILILSFLPIGYLGSRSIDYLFHYYSRKKIIKYINKHPTDPVCKYLRMKL